MHTDTHNKKDNVCIHAQLCHFPTCFLQWLLPSKGQASRWVFTLGRRFAFTERKRHLCTGLASTNRSPYTHTHTHTHTYTQDKIHFASLKFQIWMSGYAIAVTKPGTHCSGFPFSVKRREYDISSRQMPFARHGNVMPLIKIAGDTPRIPRVLTLVYSNVTSLLNKILVSIQCQIRCQWGTSCMADSHERYSMQKNGILTC